VNTGHDLRLKSRTEKITPKDAPRVLRMRRVLRQWSHCKIASVAILQSHALIFTVPVSLLLYDLVRDSYLLVQESLAHGPVRADGGSSDGRVGVRVSHCEGILESAE
jgi:hypothetical protein